MEKEIYQIIVGVIGGLVVFGGILNFLAIRLIRKYDEQIKDLYAKTEDLSGIRKDIEWIKGEIKK